MTSRCSKVLRGSGASTGSWTLPPERCRELADFPEPVHSNLLVQDGILYLQDDESWELCAVDLASGERQVLWRPGEPDQGWGYSMCGMTMLF